MRATPFFSSAVTTALLLISAAAVAQPAPAPTDAKPAPGVDPTPSDAKPAPGVDPTPADAKGGDAPPADAAAAPGAGGGKAPTTNTDALVADAERGSSPVELPGQTYRFVGARYRAYIIPQFMLNAFADGGTTVVAHSFGPEFAIRKNGFEYVFNLSYASYAMKPVKFKSASDGETAWEIVESKLKMIQATTEFLWSTEFSPEFSLNYGAGIGLGFVFGDLRRNQAYRDASGNYVKCASVGDGPTVPNYCGNDNDHYNNYVEPSWASGGSRPIVFPLFQLQTGLRFKPSRSFAARLDAGFGTSGFLVGLGADYGL